MMDNNNYTPETMPDTKEHTEKQEEKHIDAQHGNAIRQSQGSPDKKKFAKHAFNGLNYFGFGWLVNSAMSLYITYNILPTKQAQNAIGHVENGMYKAMSSYIKATNGGKLVENGQLKHVHDKARSAAEICCMFIAGCLVLFPMKWMEDHKEEVVNYLDEWRHKHYYKQHPEAAEVAKTHTVQKEDDKVSWGKLLKARVVGMAAILGIDQAIEGVNNHRAEMGKANLDSMEWKAGAQVYDHMSPSLRQRFINFFSSKKAGIDSIQPVLRERITKTVGNNPERVVFAEQTRLFSKEMLLTLVMAGLIFAGTKCKFGSSRHKENDDHTHETESMIASHNLIKETKHNSENAENLTPSTINEEKHKNFATNFNQHTQFEEYASERQNSHHAGSLQIA